MVHACLCAHVCADEGLSDSQGARGEKPEEREVREKTGGRRYSLAPRLIEWKLKGRDLFLNTPRFSALIK